LRYRGMICVMDLPIDVRFKMTEEEFVGAVRRLLMKHPMIWVLAGFVALSVITAYVCAFPDGPGGGTVFWGGVAAISGFYLAYLLLASPTNTYLSIPREARESQLQFRFTATGVEAKSDSSASRWDWKVFRHFSEEKEFFMIYPRSGGYSILLPKRAFETPESIDALRALLKGKLRVW